MYGERIHGGIITLLEKRLPSRLAQRVARPVARKISALIGEYVLLTLAAQVMTLPVILYHFQRLSLSSLIANPLILPPQPLVMVFSGVAVFAGAISDPLAHELAWLAWPLSAYTNRLVETLASIPNGVLVLGEMSLGSVVLMYAAVLAPVAKLPGLLKKAVTPTLILTALGLLATLLWRGVWTAPDGRLHVIVNDLDGSQVVLIRGPSGETLLVASAAGSLGGPSARMINNAIDRWLSPFDRRLDGLLLNTSQSAAYNGLEGILAARPVSQAWWGSAQPAGRSGQQILSLLHRQGIAPHALQAGEAFRFYSQARIEVLASAPTGSALLLDWQNFRALIPAGIPLEAIEPADLAGLSLLVLDARDLEKTTTEEWLAIAPRAVIATPGNSSILPSGMNWLNTGPQRWYQVTTDGKRMWVEKK